MRDADGNEFEFQYTEGRRDVPIAVRMNGRVCGEIRPVKGGWQYFPAGQTRGGDVLESAGAVQQQLMGFAAPAPQ